MIQEVTANKERWLQCGRKNVEWDRVELVAGYMIMDPAFSRNFGFASTYCWWATTITEVMRKPKQWLSMLYLASNYSCMDIRDAIYGLRGLMKFSDETRHLKPDYSKSITEVYRDSVEAAFIDYQNADVLCYLTGYENPSWIPRWDQPMLFRNPFRFGNVPPWKPAGETKPIWAIDKSLNTLYLTGFDVDTIQFSEPYNQRIFASASVNLDEKTTLQNFWQRILKILEHSHPNLPFSANVLSAAAASFSFGLDDKANPAESGELIHNFISYLKIMLDEDLYRKYVPLSMSEESKEADGHAFGKPVWDFDYPESSFFITKSRLVGCAISTTEPGDRVCAALGCTYPLILRPDGDSFLVRGYSCIHGIMRGEQQNFERRVFKIC